MKSKAMEIKDALIDKLGEAEQNIDSLISSSLSEISHWKYASDEYYTHLPYYHEINKFKKGRILEGVTEGNKFSKRMIHSFGFNASDQLIIMQHPQVDDNIELGAGIHVHSINPNKSVQTSVARWYPKKNFPTKLLAINTFIPFGNDSWLYVGVNSNKKDWSMLDYIYGAAERVERVVVYSSATENPLEYIFIYENENNLDRIMIGDAVWWKSKTRK